MLQSNYVVTPILFITACMIVGVSSQISGDEENDGLEATTVGIPYILSAPIGCWECCLGETE